MPEQPNVSPLLDGFTLGPPAHDHAGVCCYPAVRADNQRKYIVKVISVPASQTQLDALLITGAYKDSAEADAYFRSQAEGIVQESRMLGQLARRGGFVPYEGCQLDPIGKNRVGYEVTLLSGFRLSLERYMYKHAVSHLEAVNLGIDLCTALAACREAGMLYVALKPSNVFISNKKEYKIGDLGFVPLRDLKFTPMPEKYRSPYTAPELLDDLSVLNETADTYSAGLILYQIFNNGALPDDLTKPLPAPASADEEMSSIVLKACDPNPAKRWETPAQMRQALVDYMQRGTINDTPIMDPLSVKAADSTAAPAEAPPPAEAEAPQEAAPAAEAAPAEREPAAPIAAPEEAAEAPAAAEETAAPEVPEVSEMPEAAEPPEAPEAVQAPEASESSDSDEAAMPQESPEAELTLDFSVTDSVLPETADESDSVEVQDFSAERSTDDSLWADSPQTFTPPAAPAEEETPAADVFAEDVPQTAASASFDFPQAQADDTDYFDASEGDLQSSIGDESLDRELEELSNLLRSSETPISRERRAAPNVEPVVIKHAKKKKSPLGVLFIVFLLSLLLAGGVWGYMYYIGEYLQTVNGISIQEEQGQLVVKVDSDVREGLLRVVCTDPYGNSFSEPVVNGSVSFSQVTPGTFYTVQVQITGFHKLASNISEVFTTAGTTKLAALNIGPGAQDGSAVLSMIVDGAEPANWQVYYSAEDEPELSKTFSGHNVTVENLTVGKLYTFRMEIVDGINHTPADGQNTVQFTPVRLIAPQNLEVVSLSGGELTVKWDSSSSAKPDYWIATCRGEGYDKTEQVTGTQVTFSGISDTKAYTVDVCASGMTQTARINISANPITLTNFQVDESDPQELRLSWQYQGTAPEGGWQIIYTLDSSNLPSAVKADSTSAVVAPRIPGAVYHFTIQASGDVSVFGGNQVYTCPAAANYSDKGVSAENVSIDLLPTPANADWVENAVSNDSFTQLFPVGDPISAVMRNSYGVYLDDEEINILYIFRNASGEAAPELVGEQTLSWREIWGRNSAYSARLNVPVSPTEAGTYTLDIYFNGRLIASSKVEMY